MIDKFISAGKFDPLIRFSVAKFTRFTKNIDSSRVEYYFNLGGKITLTDTSLPKRVSYRHNFAMHLFQKTGDLDMTNWDKFRILEFEDEENKSFFTGSLLLKQDMTELGRMLDQAVITAGSIELSFLLDPTLKKDATSQYMDILALHSLALTNNLAD
jgi:hypothetical protein